LWQRLGMPRLRQEKRPALTCKPLIFFGFLWLPDLGSNQGPTD
jgi:hypothetical protein